MQVVVRHADFEPELRRLPIGEQQAVEQALDVLAAVGAALGYPHTSQVKGAQDLRELRPRAGRSPWRAFYRRIGEFLVVAACGPEARVDPRGFHRACTVAEARLDAVTLER